jgi:DNA-binding CsgD family transcriptional regulator
VAEALEPASVAPVSYVLGSQGPETPVVVSGKGQLPPEQIQRMLTRAYAAGTRDEARRLAVVCRTPGVNSLRQIFGDAHIDEWIQRWHDGLTPFVDAIAVLVPGPEGKPIVLSMACAQAHQFSSLEQALWRRIAIHLGAGWRLAGRVADAEASDVEAIMTPEGRVAHASGPGTTTKGRELLRAATKNIDRARSRLGRSDPTAALGLWQGLLAGRWSLVEHFDSDGRRFMLARCNEPGFPGSSSLTRRQRQVLFYASVGLSNKEIAYALGLAENTISAHLASGLARVRLQSRAELIHVGTELAVEALSALSPR